MSSLSRSRGSSISFGEGNGNGQTTRTGTDADVAPNSEGKSSAPTAERSGAEDSVGRPAADGRPRRDCLADVAPGRADSPRGGVGDAGGRRAADDDVSEVVGVGPDPAAAPDGGADRLAEGN